MQYTDTEAAAILNQYRRWLHALAYDLLPHDSPDHDDCASEGWVAMWRALSTYDQSRGSLPTWLTGAARMRMRDLAHGSGQWFGRTPTRGSRSVATTSLDAALDADPDLATAAADLLDGVELAYHSGEIAAAIDALPPAQRAYVIARFWLGLDPTSREPAMRHLVDTNAPDLRRRHLWARPGTGARDRLAAALSHLGT